MKSRILVCFATGLLFSICLGSTVFAQGGGTGGGGTGGGTGSGGTGTGTGGIGTGGTTGTGTNGTTGTQQTQQPTRQPSQGLDTSPIDLGIELPQFEDRRNSGFVGATSASMRENGFVGQSSPALGSVPATNSTGLQGAGGTGTGNRAGGTTNRAGGAAGAGNRNLGAGGQTGLGGAGGQGRAASFQVSRSSLRAPLSNQISVIRSTPQQVVARFQNRVAQTPGVPTSGYLVSVANGIATLSGQVDSQDSAKKIERLLRLEPGVYKIDNKLDVKN